MIRKLAVCDDEKVMIRQLASYLGQIQDEIADSFEVSYYSSAEELTAHLDKSTEILLLDISMGGMTGMEGARRLRESGYAGDIIFITSMEQYAIEGYSVQAFGFITKPVVFDEFKDTLLRCLKKRDSQKKSVLAVETAGGTEILNINDIIYAEVYQHSTSFTLRRGRHLVSAVQLNEIESKLAPQGFFRCHRSYLVNMRHLTRIGQSELTLSDGSTVPLSRHRSKEFLAQYTQFMGVVLG
ncbi:MAG: response regulator transcription factor [Firmicutes bacterium]|nr:response regulator transcription factor [Bacillota bacterium]